MTKYNQHIIHHDQEARHALRILDNLGGFASRTLFVIDQNEIIIGAITDGDIRRGLLLGNEISQPVSNFMNTHFKFLYEFGDNVNLIKDYRKAGIELIPILTEHKKILEILDLKEIKTLLPVSAMIVAGGKGERMRPFTDLVPKPMLKVGNKPILEHNIDRLIMFGIKDIYISVKYLKEQIMNYFGDGSSKGVSIKYLEEDKPLGTLGAISSIESIVYDDILVMNSDLLTNIDFEDFFNFYQNNNASMALASIPYNINVPYAVLQTKDHTICSFTEKPTYTYYSNSGIYLFKFVLKKFIPKGSFYNATDLMSTVIGEENMQLIHYPLLGYWLDIGKPQDFMKAQEDIKHLNML
jgi:dTDP-glucose pyrophosphorylase